MADNAAKIAELEAILHGGVTSINVDGTSTTCDLEEIRRQLAELRRTDDTQRTRRPRLTFVKLGRLM